MTIGLTVKSAAVVVASLAEFVNTAWYKFWESARDAVKLSVVEVAPTIALNDAPPFVLTNHCTVGVGVPVAAAVKVAVLPSTTVRGVGLNVIVGATLRVSNAVLVVILPAAFVNTAS
jgi:hypothetical protein